MNMKEITEIKKAVLLLVIVAAMIFSGCSTGEPAAKSSGTAVTMPGNVMIEEAPNADGCVGDGLTY